MVWPVALSDCQPDEGSSDTSIAVHLPSAEGQKRKSLATGCMWDDDDTFMLRALVEALADAARQDPGVTLGGRAPAHAALSATVAMPERRCQRKSVRVHLALVPRGAQRHGKQEQHFLSFGVAEK